MNEPLTVVIASLPDREQVVAELWCGNVQAAELSQGYECLRPDLYPAPNGQPWTFEYASLVRAFAETAQRLTGGSPDASA